MLDSMRAVPTVGMSILGENPFLERLDRGMGLGLGLEPPPFLPLPPRLWHPTVWGSPPPCPPPPPPPLPLCPEPCHLPALTGVGVSHLFDYMTSARLWYPWYYKGDSLLTGSVLLDSYDAVGKELPTRALKQERLKERQDLVQALSIDKDHSAKINARKSAATQTQFSSFGDAPPYPGPPPSYFAPRGDGHPGDGYSPVHHTYTAPLLPPPPPHPATLSSPALSPSSPGHLVDFAHPRISPDIQNAPLNLSLSSCPSTASSSLTRQQPRPSVITCAASSMSTSTSGSSSPRSSHNGHMVLGSSSSSDDPIDPAIEEHFRRSLGRSYGESISRTSITAATVQANVSITGSVDEHFAKSLGDSKWKAIKSKNDSVDDHFAKALGETTWRLIKAENEIAENSTAGATSSSNSATAATSAHTGTSLSAPVAS